MTRFLKKNLLTGILIGFSSFVFAGTMLPTEICPTDVRHCRLSLRHIEGGGIGYDKGYTSLDLFLAPDPLSLSFVPFLDLRGHVFDNGRIAANAGIGYRSIWGQRIYGVNAYYDYRNTKRLSYNQFGFGFETIGKVLDFRFNSYVPVGNTLTSPYSAEFAEFAGNSLLISQKYQFAMRGVDAEIGYHFGKSRLFDFYAAAGPYYYIGKFATNTWGGKARVAGMYKEYITLELSDSYDGMFYNNFQCQVTFTLPLGGRSHVTKEVAGRSCQRSNMLASRIVQPVGREEIIVVGKERQNSPAINPLTGQPFFFVFVNNTSSSSGTYESPYPTLLEAQNNSSANDIIYVFPGDGTTTGMDAGIALKANQKLWGSGRGYTLQTTEGTISIPAQTSSFPRITNRDLLTDGNAVTLATNNALSGLIISTSLNDAIFGTNPKNLDVSHCIIENTTTYAIEATFSDTASVSITNNQFSNNVNGVALTFNEAANLICSENTFEGQTSVSSTPLDIGVNNASFTSTIENNVFDNNMTGSIRFNYTNALNTAINVLSNTMTNNSTGSQSNLASSFVIIANGSNDTCTLVLNDNTFSNNTNSAYAIFLHTSGDFTNLNVTASRNTMSNNDGAALALATPSTTLTLVANDNTITGCPDNAISIATNALTTTGSITLEGNRITNIVGNGIVINQDCTTLDLAILNNEINACDGTGIISYAPSGVDSWELNVSGNTITNCQNAGSNLASALNIERYTNLEASITNNTFTNNVSPSVAVSSDLTAPTICLSLSGNSNSEEYNLINPVDGTYRLSPCNVDAVNTGTINMFGTIDLVTSCSGLEPCFTCSDPISCTP